MMLEQLSLFDIDIPDDLTAVCCMDMRAAQARKPDAWMKDIVPDCEYVVAVGIHPLVLRPTRMSVADIPEGHSYYHYQIDGRVYAGVFIGRGNDETEEESFFGTV